LLRLADFANQGIAVVAAGAVVLHLLKTVRKAKWIYIMFIIVYSKTVAVK
jgi:hypothetical protein